MTPTEWHVGVSQHLREIRAGAEMCARHVRQMVGRPLFDTLAEDDLKLLEITLVKALAAVREARAAFERKPHVE
jgi:hypothetical protein